MLPLALTRQSQHRGAPVRVPDVHREPSRPYNAALLFVSTVGADVGPRLDAPGTAGATTIHLRASS